MKKLRTSCHQAVEKKGDKVAAKVQQQATENDICQMLGFCKEA